MLTVAQLLLPFVILGSSPGVAAGSSTRSAAMWAHEVTFDAPVIDGLEAGLFGVPVALGPATIAVVGHSGGDAIFLYRLVEAAWSEPTRVSLPKAEADWDRRVKAVGLSGEDMLTVVRNGSIYTSTWSGSEWTPPSLAVTLPLYYSNYFSTEVAITDEALAVITQDSSQACPGERTQVLVFRRDGQTWAPDGAIAEAGCTDQTPLHHAVAVDDDWLVVTLEVPGADAASGLARVYRRVDAAAWELQATLEAGEDMPGPYSEAAISDATIALGAPSANDSTGRVDVYVDRGDGWAREQSFYGEPAPEFYDTSFGNTLALDGDLMAIGARGEDFSDDFGFEAGAVHLYGFSGEWVEEATLARRTRYSAFGEDVALRGSRLVVGDGYLDEPHATRTHVFSRQGDPPAGMCLDDDGCHGVPCVEGRCVRLDEQEPGCGCRSEGGGGPLAGLIALLLLASRRRAGDFRVAKRRDRAATA